MKLYYFPTVCSLAVHIALREAELPFTLEGVNLMTGETQSGVAFKTVNTKGYVPALELDDGHIMTEGCAIMQYVADQNPESGLSPPAGTADRYKLMEWMSFISAELHKAFAPVFSPAAPPEWRDHVIAGINRRLAWLDGELAGKSYLVGDKFTIADGYMFTILNWTNFARMDMSAWPAIQAYQAGIAARPRVQEAIAAEGPPPPLPA